MLSTFLVNAQSKLLIAERFEARKFDRAIRIQAAKRIAQRNLRREIERLLKVDYSAQSVLDVLEQVIPKQTELQVDSSMRTSCGT